MRLDGIVCSTCALTALETGSASDLRLMQMVGSLVSAFLAIEYEESEDQGSLSAGGATFGAGIVGLTEAAQPEILEVGILETVPITGMLTRPRAKR